MTKDEKAATLPRCREWSMPKQRFDKTQVHYRTIDGTGSKLLCALEDIACMLVIGSAFILAGLAG